ncbi:MAG: FAD-dependent oxidoreductase [Legionellales bacterium]|nr:FAD-dependent oxidoreductase [Legionellales bacterium]
MYKKILLTIIILILICLFFIYDLSDYLSFTYLKGRHLEFSDYYLDNPIFIIGVFFSIYVLISSLSLPGAAVLTVLAGTIFDLITGVIIVSFASTIGATIAFLIAKYILHDYMQKKYSHKLANINEGIKKEGSYYLFALRLVPIMPFFIINILMGLTPIKVRTFFLISQIGMLPGTILYVFVGTTIADITTVNDILSWQIILAFSLLGLFPVITKRVLSWFKSYLKLRKYIKPKKFDYNIIVIGGGSAGLVAAYMGSQLKAKIALIEKNKMGGDCLNTGCVPSKALIKTAKVINYRNSYKKYGLNFIKIDTNFKTIMRRIHNVIKKIEPHDSIERYSNLGVDCIQGNAEIVDPYRVSINNMILTTRKIIIATGASPIVPPIKGLEQIKYLTSDNIWELENKPTKLVILGGGPIGIELAQAFGRLGIEIIIIEMQNKILLREDEEVSEHILGVLQQEGIRVKTGFMAKEVIQNNGKNYLICSAEDREIQIEFDQILIALGRKANIQNFGLEKLGIALTEFNTIKANELLQTNYSNIYVCGDVTGPYQFTHTAGYQGMLCSLNALFSWIKKFKVDYRVIPWTTFTDPEIARVGINEQEAKQKKISYDVTIYQLDELDRAIVDSIDSGFVKVITQKDTDRILGVTIVGERAGEQIAEFVLAMQHNLGLNKILQTIHVYPTMNEANRAVAGNWKKNRTNPKILDFLEKLFTWSRG